MIESVSPAYIPARETITPETDFVITGFDLDRFPDEVCLCYASSIERAYETKDAEIGHAGALELVSRSDTEMHFRYYQTYTLANTWRPFLLTTPNEPPRNVIVDLSNI